MVLVVLFEVNRPRRVPGARATVLALVAALLVGVVPMGAGAGDLRLPKGYRIANARTVAPGVQHFRVTSADQRVHIARIAPDAKARPQVAVARRGIGPERGAQRTSAMCRVHACLLGVNGDFFYTHGRPAGAIVVDGEPWITRRYDRQHLIIGADGSFAMRRVDIDTTLRARYPHPLVGIDEVIGSDMFRDEVVDLQVDAINGERGKGALVIYTPRRGPRTRTSGGVEVIARIVGGHDALALRSTTPIRLLRLREGGNARIPSDGVVLSARGEAARALRGLFQDVQDGAARPRIRVRLGGPRGADQIIGGRPVLVRHGEVRPQGKDWFSVGRHARTIAGWARDGTLYLVTIDRGGRARGMSLEEAARFVRRLGVQGALNLDGGGSTTFVRRTTVRNEPSGSTERKVGSALLITRR